jgi:GNAT superfamily N-acetyltransferase
MNFLHDECTFAPLTRELLEQCQPFSCGDRDLDDFFYNDADNYRRQLLGKSFCFRLKNEQLVIVAAFTLSNSSIDARNLPNSRRKKLVEHVPHEKSLSSYPATLIGRLGVDKNFSGKGIGTELMTVIKSWLLEPANKTACRYLTVDAYNSELTLKFYEANNFKCLFSTEAQEKAYIGLPAERELKTRLMYFDLILT